MELTPWPWAVFKGAVFRWGDSQKKDSRTKQNMLMLTTDLSNNLSGENDWGVVKSQRCSIIDAPFTRRDWSERRYASPHPKQHSNFCSHKPLGLFTKTMVNRGCSYWEEVICPFWKTLIPTPTPTSISLSLSLFLSPSPYTYSFLKIFYILLWFRPFYILFLCFNLPFFFSSPSNLLFIFYFLFVQ